MMKENPTSEDGGARARAAGGRGVLGDEAAAVLLPDDADPGSERDRRPRLLPVHARHPPRHVPRAALVDPPVRRVRHRRGDQRAASASCSRGPDRRSRRRSTCPRRWARLGRPGAARARSARSASPSTPWPTWSGRSTGIPLDKISTSMTINAPAAILVAMYVVVAEQQGHASVGSARHRTERRAQGVRRRGHRTSSRRGQSLRLAADLDYLLRAEAPRFNPISVSGYHIREAGWMAAQEIAFAFSPTPLPTSSGASSAARPSTTCAPRLSGIFNTHITSSRRLRSTGRCAACGRRITRDRFGAQHPDSMMFRTHTQTGGSTLTAQQPLRTTSCGPRSRCLPRRSAACSRSRSPATTRRWRSHRARAPGGAHPADHRARVGDTAAHIRWWIRCTSRPTDRARGRGRCAHGRDRGHGRRRGRDRIGLLPGRHRTTRCIEGQRIASC